MDRFRASVDAVRRGEEPPEGGYRGEYVGDLALTGGRPGDRDARRIEASLERFRIHIDSWALQSDVEQRLPELLPRLDTYEKDGALWARSSAYGDEEDRVLLRSGERTPTYRAADILYLVDKLERGLDRAIYVLGADHHGTRNWYAAVARMLGYDPDRVEVLLYQLVHLTRAASWRRCRSARRHRLPRRVPGRDRRRRGALVSRQPRPRPDDRDRRRPRGGAVAEEPRLLRAVRARAHRGDPAQRRRCGGVGDAGRPARARGEGAREAARGVSGDRREATERRAPQAIPTYAIRLADDFHRFYHEHRVLESDQQAFRLGLCRATQSVIARSLKLIGVDAPERM